MKPPHPGEISGISTFGEKIIFNLRERSFRNEEKLKKLRPKPYHDWREQEFRNYSYQQRQYSQMEFYGLENIPLSQFDAAPVGNKNAETTCIVPSDAQNRPMDTAALYSFEKAKDREPTQMPVPMFAQQNIFFQNAGAQNSFQNELVTTSISKDLEENILNAEEEVDLFDVGVESQLLRAIEELEENNRKTVQTTVPCNSPKASIPSSVLSPPLEREIIDQHEKEDMSTGQNENNLEESIVSPEKNSTTPKFANEPVLEGSSTSSNQKNFPEVTRATTEVDLLTKKDETIVEQFEKSGSTQVSQPAKKRKKFEAPLNKKLVQTKLAFEKKVQIIELNKCSLTDMESQIEYGKPLEICLMLESASKGGEIGSYKAVVMRMQWQEDNVEYCSVSRELFKTEKNKVGKFFRTVFGSNTSIVSVEAAELLVYLIHKFR